MNPDDKSFFLDAMEDVQPLKRCADIHWQPSRNTRAREEVDSEQLDNFLTLDFLDVLPLEEPLAFQREGVQLKPPASASGTLPSDALFFYPPGRTRRVTQSDYHSRERARAEFASQCGAQLSGALVNRV